MKGFCVICSDLFILGLFSASAGAVDEADFESLFDEGPDVKVSRVIY